MHAVEALGVSYFVAGSDRRKAAVDAVALGAQKPAAGVTICVSGALQRSVAIVSNATNAFKKDANVWTDLPAAG